MTASVHNSWRTRPRAERGGILVEFGLIVPIFVVLVIGAVTTGLSYNTNNSLNNAAREASRYGATLAVDGNLSTWLERVANAAEVSAGGELGDGVPSREICVAYVHPDGSDAADRSTTLLRTAAGEVISAGSACFEDGRPDDERRVQVVVGRETEIQAVVFDRTIDLEATSVARYERD